MALFELHYKREKKLKFSRRLADVHAHRLAVNVTLHSPLTNLLAAVNGCINMESPHTGTTVIAVSYNGGVVLGSDSRVSMGQYISNRASSKVTPLANDIWLLRSGSAADAQGISDYGEPLCGLGRAIQYSGIREIGQSYLCLRLIC